VHGINNGYQPPNQKETSMSTLTPQITEHVNFAAFITLCGIPQEAIDCVWESNMLADWDSTMPVPHPPSLKIADMLAMRDSSLRALGASVADAAWLDRFADSSMQPAWEGLAQNVMLPESALVKLAVKAHHLVADRIEAQDNLANLDLNASEEDARGIAAALITSGCGVVIGEALTTHSLVGPELEHLLATANGGSAGHPARMIRSALVATGAHADLLEEMLVSPDGVVDVREIAAVAAIIEAHPAIRNSIKARAHQDAVGMARRLGLFELAPVRTREPMTKEAEDVLAQFEVFKAIDPTPAARRAIRWWSSLDDSALASILEAADVETLTDWCQGAMQIAPEAEEVVELLSRMDAKRFDEFCSEVTRRPDPTEEQPALSIAIREPMKQSWRPAGVHAAVQHLTSELSDVKHWHTAMALLANGWNSTLWELAGCSKQV
jgi:hypothetical protein